MNSFLYQAVVYLAEAVISGMFLLNLLKPKYKKPFQLILWCEIVVCIVLIIPQSSLKTAAVIAAEFVFTVVMYEDKLKTKLVVFGCELLTMLIALITAFVVYGKLINERISFITLRGNEDLTYTLLYVLLFSVFSSMLYQFLKKVRGAEIFWVLGTLMIIGIGQISAILAVASFSGGKVIADNIYLVLIMTVCMVCANVSIGILAPYLLYKVSFSSNMDYGQKLSNMEFKYYEMSVENDKKLMQIRHDISNHIQTIYSLLENGETEKGFELVNELKARYSGADRMVYCNNPVVNIILSNKKSEAEEYNIETHIKVKDDIGDLPIADFDLSTVICNLIDNAIRGCICSDQSHPRLVVEILLKNQYLVVRVINSCKVNMNIESTERIETTKPNGSTSHGLGMPIIMGIAEKYRGDFIASAQNGIFTATVVMSVK